eukprot:8630461-Karenia_brevis.AAC.1
MIKVITHTRGKCSKFKANIIMGFEDLVLLLMAGQRAMTQESDLMVMHKAMNMEWLEENSHSFS